MPWLGWLVRGTDKRNFTIDAHKPRGDSGFLMTKNFKGNKHLALFKSRKPV